MIWKGDTTSILVLNQIQVDAPYEPDNCKIVAPNNGGSTKHNSKGALEDGSLDRVKKIVAAAAVAADSTSAVGS